ncbi:hypothetical protein BJ508DRAFT_89136 [Ascobolus immersus RN42]|uniref:Uncharacterized protein n=1 Tax=Ascobolus immersus RN42 TaxID=1160509 RepID=A0A3N4I8V2_ASCIM|nr:hypothetical protein BJ508DRAFT_89136 [Ascobolus immersus RN42]
MVHSSSSSNIPSCPAKSRCLPTHSFFLVDILGPAVSSYGRFAVEIQQKPCRKCLANCHFGGLKVSECTRTLSTRQKRLQAQSIASLWVGPQRNHWKPSTMRNGMGAEGEVGGSREVHNLLRKFSESESVDSERSHRSSVQPFISFEADERFPTSLCHLLARYHCLDWTNQQELWTTSKHHQSNDFRSRKPATRTLYETDIK